MIQRRGIDDWDHDNWNEPAQRPVNRQPSSSGYSSGYSSSNAVQGQNVQFRGQKIEQGNFIVTHNDFVKDGIVIVCSMTISQITTHVLILAYFQKAVSK